MVDLTTEWFVFVPYKLGYGGLLWHVRLIILHSPEAAVQFILQMHFKVAVRNFHALMQAGDSLTDVLRVVSVLWL